MGLFQPKLVSVLREGYSREMLSKDLTAGVVVGIVALPLAIAFAIASGVKPEQGIYTAIIAGFLISALGGSRVQIGGPTGAFIVLIYGIVQQYGYDGLVIATILAGLLLVAMGLARFGAILRFIPYPVTVGFTSGIAVVIATGQFRDALGLNLQVMPAHFIEQIAAYAGTIGSTDLLSLSVALASILMIVYVPKLSRRIPGSLVAIVVTTVVVAVGGLPIETVGSRFGAVSGTLPQLTLPTLDWNTITKLFSPALSIALLAGIESLLSAVVADGMTSRRHRSNTELIAQGIANIVTPLFGGIPATGAIARTATNVKNGAVSPISGIIHAAVLFVILIAAGNWAALIPLPTLAGILLVVAYNMSEIHLFTYVLKSTRSDAMVLLTTFLLTVLVDLTVAIQVGVVLAAFLFMKRMADVAQVRALTGLLDDGERDQGVGTNPSEAALLRTAPEGVEVFEVNGPFFFGAAHKFQHALSELQRTPKVIVLRMRNVLALDATGLRVLEESLSIAQRGGPKLLLSEVHSQPIILMERSGFLDRLGQENITGDLESTFARAQQLL